MLLAYNWNHIWCCLVLLSWLNILYHSVLIQFAWFKLQMKSVHLSIWGDIDKYLALFVYGSKRLKRLYQSQFLLNWVYLTCGRVCNLGMLHCADKSCLYLFVETSKIQYLAQSLANSFCLTCDNKYIIDPLLELYLASFGIVCITYKLVISVSQF